MTLLVTIFILILLVATVGSLFAGVLSMGAGGEFDDHNSTRLMFARVGLQGLAVALIVLLLFVLKG